MKKKNLIVLLLMPFLISILSLSVVKVTVNFVDNDITSIIWDYEDTEAFAVSNMRYALSAKGVNNSKYALSEGNTLIWSVTNLDGSKTNIAKIESNGNSYYLSALSTGEVLITCSNEKKTVFKTMKAKIYDNAAITCNDVVKASQNNIDSMIYYGEFDIINNKLQTSSITYKIGVYPTDFSNDVIIKETSDNISAVISNNKVIVNFISTGDAYFKIGFKDNIIADEEVKFFIVKDGVNVYSYDDLLYCTNKSQNGEIVVLKTSLESYSNTYDANGELIDDGIKLFGNLTNGKYNFSNEIYQFETTYNHTFIDEWNDFCTNDNKYQKLSTLINVGIHVQKDFYGNGYTINLHNLTYPYDEMLVNTDDGTQLVPLLTSNNLFRGPLPFYTLGDPNNTYLIQIYGQDNIGLYVDGNNITINDLDIRNCDFGNTLSNLDYVGSVVEVNGDNNVIKNSRLSNGKHVLRSFSSNNLTVDNSILKNARNFLFYTGSNEYVSFDDSKTSTITNLSGNSITDTNINLNKENGVIDEILETFIMGKEEKEKMKEALLSIQKIFNNDTANNYKGSSNLNDVIFYQSGISSIGVDAYFSGAFLYNALPSTITSMLSGLSLEGKSILPFIPKNMSYTSYPVKINITGNTLFYDYKDINTLDLSGLIGENITAIANNNLSLLGDKEVRTITIDDIFPMKSLLFNKATLTNNKLCPIVSFYGGGVNNSTVHFGSKVNIGNNIKVDLLDSYLNMSTSDSMTSTMKNMMIKVVTTVTGFEPFNFICYENGYLYGLVPNINDLKRNEV